MDLEAGKEQGKHMEGTGGNPSGIEDYSGPGVRE